MLVMDKKQKIVGAALAVGAVAIGIVGYGESKKLKRQKNRIIFFRPVNVLRLFLNALQ